MNAISRDDVMEMIRKAVYAGHPWEETIVRL